MMTAHSKALAADVSAGATVRDAACCPRHDASIDGLPLNAPLPRLIMMPYRLRVTGASIAVSIDGMQQASDAAQSLRSFAVLANSHLRNHGNSDTGTRITIRQDSGSICHRMLACTIHVPAIRHDMKPDALLRPDWVPRSLSGQWELCVRQHWTARLACILLEIIGAADEGLTGRGNNHASWNPESEPETAICRAAATQALCANILAGYDAVEAAKNSGTKNRRGEYEFVHRAGYWIKELHDDLERDILPEIRKIDGLAARARLEAGIGLGRAEPSSSAKQNGIMPDDGAGAKGRVAARRSRARKEAS